MKKKTISFLIWTHFWSLMSSVKLTSLSWSALTKLGQSIAITQSSPKLSAAVTSILLSQSPFLIFNGASLIAGNVFVEMCVLCIWATLWIYTFWPWGFVISCSRSSLHDLLASGSSLGRSNQSLFTFHTMERDGKQRPLTYTHSHRHTHGHTKWVVPRIYKHTYGSYR